MAKRIEPTMRFLLLASTLLLALPPLHAQAASDLCTRPLDEHVMVINIRGNHSFQVGGREATESSLLSLAGRASHRDGVNRFYLVVEPEATYAEAQGLADRLLASLFRVQMAFLQPPNDGSSFFHCVAAARSRSTDTLLQKIPRPASRIPPPK